jgi:CRISPR-associated protein Cas2
MVERKLHIVAYDIEDTGRRARALKTCKAYGVGGQKSVHECLLTRRERHELEKALKRAMDMESDRLLVVRLDPRAEMHGLGQADFPPKPPWFYVG